MKTLKAVIDVSRPNQWVKNLSLFAAIIFTGQLFNPPLLILSFYGFLIFCFLSSSSYILNDVIDAPLDKLHPIKSKRPIAKEDLSKQKALGVSLALSVSSLIFAFKLSFGFFLVSFLFLLLHIFYSLYFKKQAVADILAIASSFLLRVFAGEVLTGFHLPVWLTLSVIFLALFIASCKRHSELLLSGAKTRPALAHYREKLLNFYTSTFATVTLITYSLFTFLEQPPQFSKPLREFLKVRFPLALGRKWMMITIPFVILGLMRYAQLIYEKKAGEKPEKIITTDVPLVLAILGWGATVILIIYVL